MLTSPHYSHDLTCNPRIVWRIRRYPSPYSILFHSHGRMLISWWLALRFALFIFLSLFPSFIFHFAFPMTK